METIAREIGNRARVAARTAPANAPHRIARGGRFVAAAEATRAPEDAGLPIRPNGLFDKLLDASRGSLAGNRCRDERGPHSSSWIECAGRRPFTTGRPGLPDPKRDGGKTHAGVREAEREDRAVSNQFPHEITPEKSTCFSHNRPLP